MTYEIFCSCNIFMNTLLSHIESVTDQVLLPCKSWHRWFGRPWQKWKGNIKMYLR